MACFLVPTGEALVVKAIEKIEEKKEVAAPAEHTTDSIVKVPLSKKLKWLSHMLWGGAALLAFEHVWHGEVVPFPPFLTAMNDAADKAEMLHEMSTVGVTMAAIITLVWLGMCVAADVIVKRPETSSEATDTL
jgi:hypothetical protein